MRKVLGAALAGTMIAGAALAGPVSFSSGWNEQRVQLFRSNSYSFGAQLGIQSDDAVSLAWTRLPTSEWGARGASWQWQVAQSVPATDLGRKGGDDRNISIYFVFLPESEAQRLSGQGIRSLLNNETVRVLQYAWGGNHGRGQVLASPYAGSQGATVVLRNAGTGAHSENVDLARDYQRAFGGTPGALVGLAVSADSDDTDSVVSASIANMVLR